MLNLLNFKVHHLNRPENRFICGEEIHNAIRYHTMLFRIIPVSSIPTSNIPVGNFVRRGITKYKIVI